MKSRFFKGIPQILIVLVLLVSAIPLSFPQPSLGPIKMEPIVFPKVIPTHYYKFGDNTRVWVTSYGNYTMDKAKPFYMSYRDWNGTLQVSNSVYWINTTAIIDIAKASGAVVLTENNSQFRIKYNVVYKGGSLSKDSIIGKFDVLWRFFNESMPKITITFTKDSGNWTSAGLGDFNIIWVVLPTQPYVRVDTEEAIPYTALTTPTPIEYANNHKRIAIGNNPNPILWRTYLVVDWQDVAELNTFAYCGAEKVFGGKGITVKFPTNTEKIDPSIALDSSAHGSLASWEADHLHLILSTTLDNELLIIDVNTFYTANYIKLCTKVEDNNSLLWTLRAEYINYTAGLCTQRFWAIWSSHGNIEVTAYFTTAGGFSAVQVYGIQNANLNNPFNNGTINYSIVETNTPTATISTTSAHTMLISTFTSTNTNDPTPGTGYTSIWDGDSPFTSGSEYKVLTSAGLNTAYWTLEEVAKWGTIVDAINEVGYSGGGGETTTVTTTTTTTTTATETSTTTTTLSNATATVHDPVGPTILPSWIWAVGAIIASFLFLLLAFKWPIFGFISFSLSLVVFLDAIANGWSYDVAYSNGTHIISSIVTVQVPTFYLSVIGIILLIQIFATIILVALSK